MRLAGAGAADEHGIALMGEEAAGCQLSGFGNSLIERNRCADRGDLKRCIRSPAVASADANSPPVIAPAAGHVAFARPELT
jgi:hypothetical protein